ncbi:MAG: N-6 DNA methylase, partial [Dolichospermum sp.]
AARDGVTKKNGKVVRSIPQEVAFLNRCLEFLAPGGKLAIVLPDGVLANSTMQDVRDWILRWAILKAIVSLPQETFRPYGAAVKTSVVLLEKRDIALTAESQLEIEQDDKIYMARIDDIGYDTSGRISAAEDEVNEPPEVKKAITDLAELLGR